MVLPQKAAVVGCGVIGSGWAARLRLCGVQVVVADPSPDAARIASEVMRNASSAWEALGLPTAEVGSLIIASSVQEAVDGAEFIQESVPERLEAKQAVLEQIEEAAVDDALIASSTSGFKPTDLQEHMKAPARLVVGHPFNPVYLLPLVEVVGGGATSPATIERAMTLYKSLGMKPLQVRVEIDAFIADRLLEAVWREALWLVNDGVATTAEIDDAIKYGFGLRWAQMGMYETYRVAGGEAGMRHFIAQFGEALEWPWTKLMDTPELTDELVERIAAQSDDQAAGRSVRELEQIRDRNLVSILLALEQNEWAAGATLARHRAALAANRHS
ncbi:MAG: 3-hydroxyacyl-CoA dehydrogenase NAD-binding domain-containing protein [Acidimicrobiales bacterium]